MNDPKLSTNPLILADLKILNNWWTVLSKLFRKLNVKVSKPAYT
jgi:hypothetical protein